MDGKFVQIGKKAADSGYAQPKTGPQKYTKDYIRYISATQMMAHFPNGTGDEDVHVSVAHPPDAINYRQNLMDAIGGTYKITTVNGDKIKFKVKSVVSWDEASGGIVRYLQRKAQDVSPRETMMIIDIGGKVSSMTEVDFYKVKNKWELDIKYDEQNRSTTYYQGILSVYENLERELINLHGDLVRDLMPLSNHRDLIAAVIRNKGFLKISGKMVDVYQAYKNAIDPFHNAFSQNLNILGNGKCSDRIILTGGGSAALSEYFFPLPAKGKVKEEDKPWIDHDNIHFADTLAVLQQANVRGGECLFEDELAMRGLLPNG